MFQTYYLFFNSLHVELIQQSAEDAKIPPQLSVPHTRLPTHSPSLSQSPSPNSQGYKAVQHSHVADVVQSQTVPFETGVVVVVVVVVVEIIDASEIKQKRVFAYQVTKIQLSLTKLCSIQKL